jgi:leucyl aminopeptidase
MASSTGAVCRDVPAVTVPHAPAPRNHRPPTAPPAVGSLAVTTLSLSSSSAATLKVDAVVIGVAKGPKGLVLAPGAEAIGTAFGKQLLPALVGLGATGKAEQLTSLATLGATTAKVVVAVGLGELPARGTGYDAEALRRAAGAAVRALAGTAKVALTLAAVNGEADPVAVRAVGEGALLGAYAFDRYRTTDLDERREPVRELVLAVPRAKDKAVRAAVRRAEVVARAVSLARDLVNTPPSDLHPVELAEVARTEAKRVGVDVEVLEGKELAKGGYGGIIGVGQGSANGPRLVHLSYRGASSSNGEGGTGTKVALVGKGITFDSGGLSLKPAASMEEMKGDMGGAAAVLAAVTAVAELALPIDVEAWVPMAENMPSGTAIRPSDILTMRGGKTVEVTNTDAEGRLILADAIARACEDAPDVLLDVATLTGAQLVALGARTTGVMGNDDNLRGAVVEAATRAGEPSWAMPLPPELRKGLDSEIADMVNSGPREGGMLTAGLFLKDFVGEGVRWAHLDIAGPSFNSADAYGYTPHGGTGAAVRTFVQLLEDLSTTA